MEAMDFTLGNRSARVKFPEGLVRREGIEPPTNSV